MLFSGALRKTGGVLDIKMSKMNCKPNELRRYFIEQHYTEIQLQEKPPLVQALREKFDL